MELTGQSSGLAIDVRPARQRPAVPTWHPLRSLRIDRWTGWHLIAALVMGALGVWATFDAWQDIYTIASKNEEYSHVFLVPLVAAWMVWVRRLRLRHCKPTGTIVGIMVVAAGWAVHSLGFYNNYQSLWHAGAVLVVIGCALSVLGRHAIFRFFPAIAVLVFLIPVPGMVRLRIAAPLQQWTAQISEIVLQAMNIAIERNGNLLSVNGQPVNIAEACNGLRMVFALILVSYAFGFGLPLRNSVRIIILLASPIAAILCNVVRILPTVWLYGLYKPGTDEGKHVADMFHNYSGWLMLPISFLILLGIIKILRWAMIPVMRYTLAS